jgi:aerobic carbon-monoxide dehydrogenase medium subunit
VGAESSPSLVSAASVDQAVGALARLGEEGAALAGGTWIMRAPLRGEAFKPSYVALRGVEELHRLERGDPTVLGSLLTHAELAVLERGAGPLGALAEAARRSAFPAVRSVATLGGNLCAAPFPEADLVPALLALDARVDLVSPAGAESVHLAEYVASRASRPAGELVRSVTVPAPSSRRSSYERLTIRGGGEYPLVSVAVAVELDDDGIAGEVRVAVGSVEEVARRSGAAEAALAGRRLGAAAATEAGRAAVAELAARDDRLAPGWYRLAVLPALLRTAIGRIVGES